MFRRGGGEAYQNGLLATEGGILIGVLKRRVAGSKLSPCTFSPFLPAKAETGRRYPRAPTAVPLPPSTTSLHLAAHCCLAGGDWAWSLAPSGGTSAQTPQYPPLSGVSSIDGNREGAPGANNGPERCQPHSPDASAYPPGGQASDLQPSIRPGLLHPFNHCL